MKNDKTLKKLVGAWEEMSPAAKKARIKELKKKFMSLAQQVKSLQEEQKEILREIDKVRGVIYYPPYEAPKDTEDLRDVDPETGISKYERGREGF